MRILLSFVVVLAAMATFTTTSEAQCAGYANGYQFGTGVRFSGGLLGQGFLSPREQAPYFAKFPPVYYSHIVKRPYGISPFAAPPGIAPVEMGVPAAVTVKNPFFEGEVAPVSNEVEVKQGEPVKDEKGNKVTWKSNPYIESVVIND